MRGTCEESGSESGAPARRLIQSLAPALLTLFALLLLPGLLPSRALAAGATDGDAAAPAGALAPPSADFLAFLRAAGVDGGVDGDATTTGSNGESGFIPPPIALPAPTARRLAPLKAAALNGSDPLPAGYDLRTLSRLTGVRNQGALGTCWAFSATASLESWLLPAGSHDFSEDNMTLLSGYGPFAESLYMHGGNDWMATAYLARWAGPVDEASDAYGDSLTPAGLQAAKHVQDVLWIPAATGVDNAVLKRAVMDYGAISTSFYWNGLSSYYKSANAAYHYPATASVNSTNHAVVIVGWDDAYAAANFATPPAGPGAWIVKNSWGSGWGSSGYFYASYYDKFMGAENYAYDSAAATDNYDHVYQHDELGLVDGYGFSSPTAWLANRFTAAGAERLAAVSTYAWTPATDYEVWAGPSLGSMTRLTSGQFAYAGYHTIDLSNGPALPAGGQFMVAVKLTTPGFTYPIPIERRWSGYSGLSVGDPGQSFISADGSSWTDFDSKGLEGNVCLKAFTTVAEVRINGGASSTATARVLLNSDIAGVTEMRFSNAQRLPGDLTGWEPFDPIKVWQLSAGSGVKTVWAQFRDADGSVEVSDDIALDAASPGGAMRINGGASSTAALAVSLSNDVSGATEMRFRDAGGVWSAWEAFAAGKAWTLPAGAVPRTVAAQFRNADGLVLDSSDTIVVDASAPSGTMVIGRMPQYLNNVRFATADVGWAVGEAGAIQSTVDGGVTWTSQTSGTEGDLTGIDAISASTAWAVGLDGVILSTTNGGATWQKRTSGTSEFLLTVDFVDADKGWAVGGNGTILTSANGGASWSRQTSFKTDILTGVSFRDDLHGLAVGDLRGVTNGSLLRTVDGGVHWTSVSTPGSRTLYDVTYADATHAWAVGENGTVLKSSNDGATWSVKSASSAYALDAVSFNGVANGIAVGSTDSVSPYHAVLLTTSDGGDTWVKRDSGTTNYLYGVDFVTAEHGYASGDGGTMLRLDMAPPSGSMSVNGGAAWTASRTVSIASAVTRAVEMRLRMSGGAWGAWVAYSATAPLELVGAEGTLTVEAQYRSSEGVLLSTSDQVGLDLSAPATSDDAPSGWNATNVIVHLAASDAGSGVQHSEYQVDGGAWQSGASVTVLASLDESNNGTHTIAYRSVDNLGNSEATQSCAVKIWVSARGDPPAEPTLVSAQISGGALAITTAMSTGSFVGTLRGEAQVIHAASAEGGTPFSFFTISDPRGTGVGWSVTMKATRFVNQSHPGKDLAFNSLSVPAMSVEKADAGSSSAPTSVQNAVSIDVAGDPVEIARCNAAGDGMGSYDFVQALGGWALSLGADEYAGMYSSTVTTTLSTQAL